MRLKLAHGDSVLTELQQVKTASGFLLCRAGTQENNHLQTNRRHNIKYFPVDILCSLFM